MTQNLSERACLVARLSDRLQASGVKLTRPGPTGPYRGDCPLPCHQGKRNTFYYYGESDTFNCFGCPGKSKTRGGDSYLHGNVVEFLHLMTGTNKHDIALDLLGQFGIKDDVPKTKVATHSQAVEKRFDQDVDHVGNIDLLGSLYVSPGLSKEQRDVIQTLYSRCHRARYGRQLDPSIERDAADRLRKLEAWCVEYRKQKTENKNETVDSPLGNSVEPAAAVES